MPVITKPTKTRPMKTDNTPFHPHALVFALSLIIGTASAATINVNGSCTLSNAINNANADTDTDGADGCASGNGADIIKLKANTVLTLNNPDNYADGEGENGLPSISSDITLNGNGATIRRADDAGTPDFRLLHIAPTGNLKVDKLALDNGNISSYYFEGGAILNHGMLTLSNSHISNSHAEYGGGIANLDGTLTLNGSSVSHNKAATGGGIITINGTTTLNDSTLSGNKAFTAGGMMNGLATVTISNSTLSGNKANDGGGISNRQATVTITNSTLSGNKATRNGGIGNHASNLTMTHSTVANNQGGGLNNQAAATLTNNLIADNNGGDCLNTGSIIFKGLNLIEDGSCNAALDGNPRLGPLLDNGGLTQTHAPLGRLAANKIPQTLCAATDQRHVVRPQPTASKCAIGAFERIGTPPSSVASTVQAFDDGVAASGIIGTKTGGFGEQQTLALRNQLLAAGDYQLHGQPGLACKQLARTLLRIDPDGTPDADDYVTGNQTGALIEDIENLRSGWGC